MSDEIDERLSQRFESDEGEDEQPQSEDSDMSSNDSQTNKTAQTSQNAQKPKNIKKEWNVRSFYLDDDLDANLSMMFKRLDLRLSETDTDVDIKKTRHFYPLIVELGLERLEEMESTEVTERLDG